PVDPRQDRRRRRGVARARGLHGLGEPGGTVGRPGPDRPPRARVPSRPRVARRVSPLAFGAATAGFQVEGGFNGPGEPRNNWYDREAAGRIERSGAACDSWNRWEEDLDAIAAMGLDWYRMSVEWA